MIDVRARNCCSRKILIQGTESLDQVQRSWVSASASLHALSFSETAGAVTRRAAQPVGSTDSLGTLS